MNKTVLRFFTIALSSTLLISNVYANESSPPEGDTTQNAIEYNAETNSYKFLQDVDFEAFLEAIKGDKITVDGNNYNIDGKGQGGLTITADQVYNFSNVGDKTANPLKGVNNFDKAGASGGVINNAGELTITNSVFTGNKAVQGGAINNTGKLNVFDSVFSNNNIYGETTGTNVRGGAIYSGSNGNLTIDNSKFIGNSATSQALGTYGGAIYNTLNNAIAGTGVLTINNSTFEGNTATTSGSAIYNAGVMTINNSEFSGNSSNDSSGAFYNKSGNDDSKLIINNSVFEKNSSNKYGGVSWNDGILEVNNSTFIKNYAESGGGVFQVNVGGVTVTNSTFIGNETGGTGGAVRDVGSGFFIDSNFYNNSAKTSGGAIYNSQQLIVYTENNNSVFTGNTANGVSNAIYNDYRVFFNPNKGTQIILNDGIDGSSNKKGTIYIDYAVTTESGYLPMGGDVVFNNTVKNNTINIQGKTTLGTFEGGTFYGKEVAASEGNFDDTTAVNLGAWGTIDTINDSIKSDYKIGTLNSTNGRLALDLEFNGENDAKADMYTINAGNGTINFDNINVFGEMPTTTKEIKIIDGAAAGNFKFGEFSAITSDDVITFKKSDNAGYIKYEIEENNEGLKTAVDLNVPSKSYKLTKDEIVQKDLGELQGVANRPFTINGNKHSIDGDGKEGITITENQIVNLQNISSIKGFKNDTAFTNSGEINLSNVTLNNKIEGPKTKASGGGVVNFTNTNTLNSEISNNDINVYGGLLNFGASADVSKANSFNVYSAPTLNLQNNEIQNINLGNVVLNSDLNLNLDSNFAAKKMDTITVDNFSANNNKINIRNIKVLKPTTDTSFSLTPIGEMTNETAKNALANAITYKGEEVTFSPIFKYNVEYDPKEALFTFKRADLAGGALKSSYQSLNPSIMAGAAGAQVGGYLTQLNSYDEAFKNMDMYMLMPQKQRQALKLRNKYASIAQGAIFDSPYSHHENSSAWFRPYTTFENISLNNGPKVSNIAYGTFFGGDSELYELAHGWDIMWGVYGGYNGSHQSYDGVSIYQNGGTLGVNAFAYKGNFFTGLTANAGASVGTSSGMFGNDDFTMLMSGVASKTGYNQEFKEGRFIIQPSFLMSYSFVNIFDYTTNSGVRINSDPLHAIQIEPGIKFIINTKSGWQPYFGVSMIWNVIDKTHFKANDVMLPNLSIDPFVRYGAGVRRAWKEKFTGFFQTYVTNGGRNGVGLQAGFSWLLGKNLKQKTK